MGLVQLHTHIKTPQGHRPVIFQKCLGGDITLIFLNANKHMNS